MSFQTVAQIKDAAAKYQWPFWSILPANGTSSPLDQFPYKGDEDTNPDITASLEHLDWALSKLSPGQYKLKIARNKSANGSAIQQWPFQVGPGYNVNQPINGVPGLGIGDAQLHQELGEKRAQLQAIEERQKVNSELEKLRLELEKIKWESERKHWLEPVLEKHGDKLMLLLDRLLSGGMAPVPAVTGTQPRVLSEEEQSTAEDKTNAAVEILASKLGEDKIADTLTKLASYSPEQLNQLLNFM